MRIFKVRSGGVRGQVLALHVPIGSGRDTVNFGVSLIVLLFVILLTGTFTECICDILAGEDINVHELCQAHKCVLCKLQFYIALTCTTEDAVIKNRLNDCASLEWLRP